MYLSSADSEETSYRRNYNAAEKRYKRALQINPDDHLVLVNYAGLLTNVRKDHDKAERYFKNQSG